MRISFESIEKEEIRFDCSKKCGKDFSSKYNQNRHEKGWSASDAGFSAECGKSEKKEVFIYK